MTTITPSGLNLLHHLTKRLYSQVVSTDGSTAYWREVNWVLHHVPRPSERRAVSTPCPELVRVRVGPQSFVVPKSHAKAWDLLGTIQQIEDDGEDASKWHAKTLRVLRKINPQPVPDVRF